MLQWYVTSRVAPSIVTGELDVPGPLGMLTLKLPSSAVAVCGTAVLLFQMTLSPASTFRVAGANWYGVVAGPLALTVTLRSVAAAGRMLTTVNSTTRPKRSRNPRIPGNLATAISRNAAPSPGRRGPRGGSARFR